MKRSYLVSEKGQFQKSIYPLESNVTIGRGSENDITISDLSISRSHAKISLQGDTWVIEDLGSSNGIIFSGKRVDKKELVSGDTFEVGEVELRFMVADSLDAAEQLFNTLEKFATTIMYASALLERSMTKPRLERLQEALQSTPVFDSLGEKELKRVASAANLHLFSPGQSVIWEGDPSRSLYIVLEGRVEAFVKQFGGEKFQLAILENNQFFGEISLLTGEPRPMSVATMEKSLLAEITYKNMRQLTANYPQINRTLHKYFQERVRDIKKKLRQTSLQDPMRHPRLRERVPVSFTVSPAKSLSKEISGDTYQATSINISSSDITLLVKGRGIEAFRPGHQLQLEVSLPPPWGNFRNSGTIRRVVPEGQTAKLSVEFFDISQQNSQKLKDYIRGEYHAQDRRTFPSASQMALEFPKERVSDSWLSPYLRVILPIAAVLLLGLVSLRFYVIKDTPTSSPPISLEANNATEILVSLQTALEKYAAAHQDRYPQSLDDLFPKFLADTLHNRKLMRHILYDLDEKSGYRLRLTKGSPISGKNLVATAEDIYLPEGGT
jgi:CRP-like cAMP-binding protein